jgi:hypothetical protein
MSTSWNRAGESKPTVLSTLPSELPLDFLKTITDQFSEKRILGVGAFGTVYEVCFMPTHCLPFSEVSETDASIC